MHVLPQLWFRNTWSWTESAPSPVLATRNPRAASRRCHAELGVYYLHVDDAPPRTLFCDNDSNPLKLWNDADAPWLLEGRLSRARRATARERAVNPNAEGTKAAIWYRPAGAGGPTAVLRLRFAAPRMPSAGSRDAFEEFDASFAERIREADEFYAQLQQGIDERGRAQRAAPGLRRHDLEQTVLLLRRAAMAATAIRPSRRRRRSAATAAIAIGCI